MNRKSYYHHGVYIDDNEVIHFTGHEDDSVLDFSKPEVIQTDVSCFSKGGVIEVKEYTDEELNDLYAVDHIIQYARACLGDKGYHVVFNNCEHFANVCTLGRFKSGQVERVFDGIVQGRKKDMGFWGSVGGFVKGLFGGSNSSGGRSTSNTTYEPDKVKIAEIERDTKLRLAEMETERIEIMKNARIETLEREYYFKVAHEEAKARGLSCMAQTIITMQDKLNEMAEKRLQIIEKGSLPIIKEIEGFYGELGRKIQDDHDEYKFRKLPLLLDTMNKFEKDSDAYAMYQEMINEDKSVQLQLMMKQMDNVSKRQSQIVDGFIRSKERIMEQTAQITAGILEKMTGGYSEAVMLGQGGESPVALTGVVQKLMIENAK